MANCRTCGAPLSRFTFGAAPDQCEGCRRIHAAVQPSFPQSSPQQVKPDEPAVSPSTPAGEWLNATTVLIAINVLVFVLMVAKDPTAFLSPNNQTLIRWGATFGPLTLDNQPWRTITAGFLHIGIVHILVNMWSLWVLGRLAERFVGVSSMIALYFLTGIGAIMMSLAYDPFRVSAGASGPIFGYVGAMIGILYFAKSSHLDPGVRKNLLGYVVKIAAINLFIGLKSGIDNMAHLGGLLTGAAVGAALVLSTRVETHDRAAMRRNIFLAAFVVLALLFVPLRAAKKEQLGLYKAVVALEKKDPQTALAILRPYVQQHPNEADGHTTLGVALQDAKQEAEAQTEYERALTLNPNDHVASVNLAIIYVDEHRAKEALPLFKAHFDQVQPDEECYRAYGEALVETGDPVTAEEMLKKAIQMDANDARAHAALALVFTMQHRNTDAQAEFKAADELKAKQGIDKVKP